MSFLKYQKENPEFLNNYLKYTRFIELAAETTVNEMYIDLRTYFRYLKLIRNSICPTKKALKGVSIKDVTLNYFVNITSYNIDEYLYFLKYELDNIPSTRNRKLATLKNFYKYLFNNNLIPNNPTAFTKAAQVKKRLPKHLDMLDSKKLLSGTLTNNSRNNIRNYTIICLFLHCCLRLSELVEINITDIKLDDKTIKIKGKGNKERIVYLDDAVVEAIKKYLEIRPTLDEKDYNYNALFLSEQKKRISRRSVQNIIKQELYKVFKETKTEIHTHSLRHTGATLLYNENNTSILIIQKILGHKALTSTEIYTHVSNKKLKEIMEKCTISSILERMGEL